MMEHGMQTNVKQNCNIFSCYIIFDLTVHQSSRANSTIGLLLAIAPTYNIVHYCQIVKFSSAIMHKLS